MKAVSTDRARVQEVIEAALAQAASPSASKSAAKSGSKAAAKSAGGAPLGIAKAAGASSAAADREKAEQALREALAWMTEVEPRLAAEGTLDDEADDEEYVSSHPAVALVQSAMEAAANAPAAPTRGAPLAAAASSGIKLPPISLVFDRLKYLSRPLPPFLPPQPPVRIADECTVAIVADWGTGDPGAVRVAQAMRRHAPNHVIHLGDVYHAGTPDEVDEKFLRVLRQHGPPKPAARYWALPGNHEMYSRGHGYYDKVLPFCEGQKASCFALETTHWRLIGLDTAYRDHDLFDAQHDWLRTLVRGDPAKKKILLSHHQVFSKSDGRPNGSGLRSTMDRLLAGASVFGWFWGHEHRGVLYDPSPTFGSYRARCIGHGGKKVSPFKPKDSLPSAPVRTLWEVPDPADPGRVQNGFALLKIKGPKIEISYVDETGFEWHPEEWG